jgi:MazG family protein
LSSFDERLAKSCVAFAKTIAALRDPKTGCPWDLEQDHQSLCRFMIEEAYEAASAMQQGDDRGIREELGDVLLQVVLNSQVAKDREVFDLVDVIDGINQKMIRRHPHVFGTTEERNQRTVDQIKQKWVEIKAEDKKLETKPKSTFAEAEKVIPATSQAAKIGKIARKIDFDWNNWREVLAQLRSEVDELEAIVAKKGETSQAAEIRAELGDVYFSLAQLARHLDLDPEAAAFEGNHKFLKRFAKVEELARQKFGKLEGLKMADLQALWDAAKLAP